MRGFFNPDHVTRRRKRRVPTVSITLEVLAEGAWMTVRHVTDEYETPAALRAAMADSKFRWEATGTFGNAPMRIVESPLALAGSKARF